MKSEYSPINTKVLAAPVLNSDFFREEGLFQGLSTKEKVDMVLHHQPKIFQVETTTRCNLNCPLCSTHHLRRGYTETRLETIERILAGNPHLKYMCLHLMGEPLLSSSLFPIIEHLKSRGVYTYFSTNGVLLEDNVLEILSSGLDKISVSLDGITQADLGRYRIGADLDSVLRGIKRLVFEKAARKLNRPLIQIQTIMFYYNEAKEGQIVRYLKSLGINRIKLKKPSFDTFGGKNNKAAGKHAALKAAGKYSRQYKGYLKYRDRSVCRLLFQGFILSDGAVVPCCIDYDGKHIYGNINHETWNDIWTSEKRRKMLENYFSNRLDICRQCSLGYDYSTTVYDAHMR